MPKRIGSGCAELGSPDGYLLSDVIDPITGGFMLGYYKLNASYEQEFSGFGKTDGKGEFVWQYAFTNGQHHWPVRDDPVDVHVVTQIRDLGAGPVVCLGYYRDSSAALAPIFEGQLPADDWRKVTVEYLDNGTLITGIDMTNSVLLLAISSAGQLMWSKELASPEIPIVSAPDVPPHTVQLHRLSSDDALLQISATEMTGSTNYSASFLVRVSSAGDIKWAKKVRLPMASDEANPYGDMLRITPSGDIVIAVLDFQSSFSARTILMRLDEQGELRWGRRITGGFLANGFEFIDGDGAMVLGLSAGIFSMNSIFAVVNNAGQLTSSVEVQLPNSGVARVSAAFPSVGRVYYEGTFAENASGETYTSIIGSSSVSLDEFEWIEYEASPVDRYENALKGLQDGRILYMAQEATTSPSESPGAHAILLNSDLTAEAMCGLFSPVSVQVQNQLLFTETATATVSNITLNIREEELTLAPADLVFSKMVFNETGLCRTDCLFTLSSDRVDVVARGGATNLLVDLNITVTDGAGCEWSVENPAPWLSASPATGVGPGQLTIVGEPNETGAARYAKLKVGDQSLVVGQPASPAPAMPGPYQWIASLGGLEGGLAEFQPEEQSHQIITNTFSTYNALVAAPDGQLLGLQGRTLYRIDTSTPSIAMLGRVQTASGAAVSMTDITFSPAGTLYGLGRNDDTLYKIDFDSLVATPIGQLDEDASIWSITFTREGRLLGNNISTLYELDPATGEIMAEIGPWGGLFTFVIKTTSGPDGFVYAIGGMLQNSLYRINPITAEAELLRQFEPRVEAIAAIPGAPQETVTINAPLLDGGSGTFGFSLAGPEGRTVIIEASTDLSTWSEVTTHVLTAEPFEFTDQQSEPADNRFYRARLE